jgi:hypothetical protein
MCRTSCDPYFRLAVPLVADSCREHRLSDHQAAELLGLSPYELDGFLKKRGVFLDYSIEDYKRECEEGERLWQKRQAELAGERDSQTK